MPLGSPLRSFRQVCTQRVIWGASLRGKGAGFLREPDEAISPGEPLKPKYYSSACGSGLRTCTCSGFNPERDWFKRPYVISVLVVVMLVLLRIAVAGWREALLRAGYYFRLWRNEGGRNEPMKGPLRQD